MEAVKHCIEHILACSMGGVLVKEMLAKAFSDKAPAHHRQLADSTSGLVFYACPHLGSNLANIGWNLRYVGASPAASVVHLKPGKHLEVSQCFSTIYSTTYSIIHLPLFLTCTGI